MDGLSICADGFEREENMDGEKIYMLGDGDLCVTEKLARELITMATDASKRKKSILNSDGMTDREIEKYFDSL